MTATWVCIAVCWLIGMTAVWGLIAAAGRLNEASEQEDHDEHIGI
jgi:hypothetical protein